MHSFSCPLPLRRLPLLLALTLSSPLALAQSDLPLIEDGNAVDASTPLGADRTTGSATTGEAASASAADADAKALDTVRVVATRSEGFKPVTVKAGTFRGASIMEVPSTVNVVTQDVLEKQGADGLYDAVRNTAGVTRQQNGGDTWDQLVIRGIEVQNRTNYRLNGSMPIMNFSQVPMENKERVEVLKGASALYYGFSSPSGIINYVTKRATRDPITSVGLKLDSNGSAIASADLGRKFGEAQQYGLRLNAAGGRLGNIMDGADDGSRAFASAAFDWVVTDRLVIEADLEYDRRRVVEQAGVQLPAAQNGVITLPQAIDPSRMIGTNDAVFRATTTNVQLRADYALSDQWALTAEVGRSSVDRDRNLGIFRFGRGARSAFVPSGAGNIQGNSQNFKADTTLARTEVAGTIEGLGLRHNLTVGLARTDKSQDPVYQRNYTVASQNLFNPVSISSVTWAAVPTAPRAPAYETRDMAVYAIDRVEISPEWQVIAGVRHSRFRSDQDHTQYSLNKTTPMGALIHRPAESLSLYASWSKALEEGETAPTGTENANQRMAPGVSSQVELGARTELGNGTLLSAALFSIESPGNYTNTDNVYVHDGKKQYRGLEVSAQGRLTRQLGWQTSLMLLDPQFKDTDARYDGKLPENASKRTASLFLSYDLSAVPGLSVNGGAFYTGRRPVNDLNQAWLGGVTLYSVGAQYRSALLGKHTTFQFNVDNVADKRYWAGAGTRLAAGMPRTFKAGVKVDF